jgi:transcriptional regulator with XRE-family HTH domain
MRRAGDRRSDGARVLAFACETFGWSWKSQPAMAGGASYGELMNTASLSFGRRLRFGRERLGISLEAIAASTKISRSLLADLERDDVSKWPPGIYRRAFVREYAEAIGLPAETVIAEFLELFPEEGTPAVRFPKAEPSNELRLTLAEDRNQALIGTVRRLLVATVELCAIMGLGWLLSAVTESEFWPVCGAIALTYYLIAAACSTRVPTFRWPAVKPLFTVSGRGNNTPSSRELIQLVLHQTPVHSADERTA